MYAGVMAHVCMSHGACMQESWHMYAGIMAHVCMSLLHTCAMTPAYVRRHFVDRSRRTCEWVMAHV